jgi:hypothetical protein
MPLIPGLTVVKKPFETYLIVRESDGDRELNAAECELLARLANGPQVVQLSPLTDEEQAHLDGLQRSAGEVDRTQIVGGPKPDLSSVEKRNAFYGSEKYRNMTTAEKCAVQGDAFLNDYD